jgi:hypothetical protein
MDESVDNKAEDNKNDAIEQPSMNEELMQWIKQEKKNIDDFKKSDEYCEKKDEKIEGLCEICGDNKAKFICFKCGQKVCNSCFFHIVGICKKCVPKNIAEKWDGTNPDWEKVLGVEWVD